MATNDSALRTATRDRAARLDIYSSSAIYRVGLALLLCAVAFASYTVTAPWSTATVIEPELLRLLRGMVVIKATFGAAIAAFVLWRFTPPVDIRTGIAYAGAASSLTASIVWLWSLVLVPVASLAFYLSLAALLVIAHRDRSLFGILDAKLRRDKGMRRHS